MSAAHFIFYVADQERSRRFYEAVFLLKPRLHVPGMTEFELSPSVVFGLMPEAGIKKLLGDSIRDPSLANGVPRAEFYWVVNDPAEYHRRSLSAGARELSPLEKRTWGHRAAYSADLDGHVIAFASMQA